MNQQTFVNRERELEFFENIYRSGKPEFVILYGRRRIGKTELLKQFSKNKRHVYYLCEKTTVIKNINNFKGKLAESIEGMEDFKNIKIEDWETLFRLLHEKLKEDRIIIIFDEFPFLMEIDRGIT